MADAQKPKGAPKPDKAAKGEKKSAKEAAPAKRPRTPKPADYVPRMKERYMKSIRAKLKDEFNTPTRCRSRVSRRSS